jgi:endonuclease-8
MPEGHTVHRIARQFRRNFVSKVVTMSSPQGRFAEGAAQLNGHIMTDAQAVGKQMFLQFDNDLWLRVHLGIYGAWDFAGDIETDATIRSAGGRMGQNNQRGTFDDVDGEDSVTSIGAPRRTRVRLHMAEQEKTINDDGLFPPPPVGAVRVRVLTRTAVADLRGPMVCEVIDAEAVTQRIAQLGPDPLRENNDRTREKFVHTLRSKQSSVGLLLMDQSVVSGIGNVYRAELLFRARLNPHRQGTMVDHEAAAGLWDDWAYLVHIGVQTGQMMTMDDLDTAAYARAMAYRADRHWVYKREGLPCRVCGTHIVIEMMAGRKLYWCPQCQA